jgi:hypothetical protein
MAKRGKTEDEAHPRQELPTVARWNLRASQKVIAPKALGEMTLLQGLWGWKRTLSPALIIVVQQPCCLCTQANAGEKFDSQG